MPRYLGIERRADIGPAAYAHRMGSYPHPSSPAVSNVMRANRRTDTKPEVALRSALHRMGLRFRKDHVVQLPNRRVRPDIVFTKAKLAVFVDGCFWHSCSEHGRTPTGSNPDYWRQKLERNRTRDRLDTESLGVAGWQVIRVWEHEVPGQAAVRIASIAARTR